MSIEQTEKVTIESIGGSGQKLLIDRATSYEIVTDLTAPAEARFELGDNGTWKAIRQALEIGRKFRVALNGRSILAGRMLMRSMPVSASTGATVQCVVRTLLADAMFTSCDQFNVKGATLKTIVLKAYQSLGATERDFCFSADVARDLITGRGKGGSPVTDLTALTEQDARVQPPETVHSFVDRHLRRFSLLHWDAPDGRIVVGKPNDEQAASYLLRCMRDYPRGNNITEARRSEDYEQVPGELAVYGQGGGRDYTRARVQAVVNNQTLMAATLRRRTMVIDEGVTTKALAQARAKREMAMRSMQRDSWDLTTPAWCHYYSNRWFPYAIDTVADLSVDVADGSANGAYYIWRVSLSGNANDSHTARITAAAKGVWQI